jgi:hypothetical protein
MQHTLWRAVREWYGVDRVKAAALDIAAANLVSDETRFAPLRQALTPLGRTSVAPPSASPKRWRSSAIGKLEVPLNRSRLLPAQRWQYWRQHIPHIVQHFLTSEWPWWELLVVHHITFYVALDQVFTVLLLVNSKTNPEV